MDYNKDKVDEMTLALLWLVMWEDRDVVRAWKSFDWDTMNRLHDMGFIYDPKGKAKSIVFTDDGKKRARELFMKHFGKDQ